MRPKVHLPLVLDALLGVERERRAVLRRSRVVCLWKCIFLLGGRFWLSFLSLSSGGFHWLFRKFSHLNFIDFIFLETFLWTGNLCRRLAALRLPRVCFRVEQVNVLDLIGVESLERLGSRKSSAAFRGCGSVGGLRNETELVANLRPGQAICLACPNDRVFARQDARLAALVLRRRPRLFLFLLLLRFDFPLPSSGRGRFLARCNFCRLCRFRLLL